MTTLPDQEFLSIFPVGPFKYWKAIKRWPLSSDLLPL